MSIHFVKGNLLEADLDYYCHQVNCQGRMGSGIAKAIREKWPIVYEKYGEWHFTNDFQAFSDDLPEGASAYMLGKNLAVPVSEKQTVINMAAQATYGYDGKRYTSYDAFWLCLGDIKRTVPKGSRIGFPDHIGCGLGGANWEVIKTMIWEALSEDFEVYIYKLEA